VNKLECNDTIEVNGVEYVRKVAIEPADDNYCIVRTYSAGVFAGNLVERNGKEGVVKNARRIWYWDGAASLSQLAMEGTKAPGNCKFPCPVNEVILTEIIEVINCTKVAEKSIKAVPAWEK
jgi:hypothetical protein